MKISSFACFPSRKEQQPLVLLLFSPLYLVSNAHDDGELKGKKTQRIGNEEGKKETERKLGVVLLDF